MASQRSQIKLEDQLAKLASVGLALEPGITIDDLLYSFDRQQYESRPFELVLFVLGVEVEREPWGRSFCTKVWNLDTECINDTGDYTAIAKRLCVVAGKPDALVEICDHVDIEGGKAWLKYKVAGVSRHWTAEVNNDWADMTVVSNIMADLQEHGRTFYGKDNGQEVVVFYLDDKAAEAINRLSGGALKPMLIRA